MRGIKIPKYIQRRPESIEFKLKHFKSSAFKHFNYHYSIVILQGVLREEYFNLYMLYVLGIPLLSRDSISSEMIDIADILLNEYVKRFAVLYGKRLMSSLVHALLHLSDRVKRTGGLHMTSCMMYEDLNGKLKQFILSSNGPDIQICSALSMYINLTTFKVNKNIQNLEVLKICDTLLNAEKK